ncbi:hypothetical protein [Actinorugispora endophytica]|uniref:Uncharacterized protein n=1 Tax=Actinorugispora endophytica TaxID=1605990 RepID=A0A4R6UR22_9ACTN|nr:hypothetical protein [Actinorugispora endophytica]TDQ48013.1 hypothetical protein EV190_12072 [Actinorugispora endophytica]
MSPTPSGGNPAEITPAMTKALRKAEAVPREPGMLRLRGEHSSQTVDALERRDLVAYDHGGGHWLLTKSGRKVHASLTAPATPGTAETRKRRRPGRQGLSRGAGPARVTVHPGLSPEEAAGLNLALSRLRSREEPAEAPEPPSAPRQAGCGRVGAFTGGGVILLVVLGISPVAFGALLLSLGLLWSGLVVAARHAKRRELRLRQEKDPERVVASLQGRFVSADALDRPARELLLRAQTAVDTVLRSSPHRQGLLLDRTRNQVVLADIEWSLAESLLRQSRNRRRIDTTPTPGERSRRAAERARAALDKDVAGVRARIKVLESYADKVRAAEREEEDRRAAEVLEAITADVTQAGAAHPYQDEALGSLVQAQELALRVASLSDPDA